VDRALVSLDLVLHIFIVFIDCCLGFFSIVSWFYSKIIEYIISRLNTALKISHGKCPQFSRAKNGGHFERRAAIGRRNMPHHSYTSGSKKVPACVRNIVLTH